MARRGLVHRPKREFSLVTGPLSPDGLRAGRESENAASKPRRTAPLWRHLAVARPANTVQKNGLWHVGQCACWGWGKMADTKAVRE